ncbi:MAG: isoaspartyl peptidase/L-asparaginase [Deltaproteobacteria bacterium]|nr:isoaspartyl peptidase/L-asparaginase [Deltaproteobacteria bacterium]
MWSIIVHGGAGAIPGPLEAQHRAGCARAVEVGAALLARGASALDAAQAAVRVLEDDPTFNAGVGATLDARGLPLTDAAVMRGEDLAYGAVGQVLGVRNPIDLARAVLEDGRHCLLVGPNAVEFARDAGVALCDPARHLTEATIRAYTARREEEARSGRRAATADWDPQEGLGVDRGNTVGAVARDAAGGLAAATSTGGLLMRYPGRVGDSPVAGAGTYADAELGALSATGHGETMLRTVFALRALQAAQAADPTEALLAALDDARARVGGKGGAILVLPDGRLAHARNTRGMGVAGQREGEALFTAF